MKKFLLCVATFLFLGSCAILFNKSSVPVKFDSDPQGANVRIEGQLIGQTPVTIDLEPQPRTYINVFYQKNGYANREFKIYTVFGGNGRGIIEKTLCTIDTTGAIFILPIISLGSSKCRSFQQSLYFKALDRGERVDLMHQFD